MGAILDEINSLVDAATESASTTGLSPAQYMALGFMALDTVLQSKFGEEGAMGIFIAGVYLREHILAEIEQERNPFAGYLDAFLVNEARASAALDGETQSVVEFDDD